MKPDMAEAWGRIRASAEKLLPSDFAAGALQAAAKERRRLRGEYRAICATAILCLLLAAGWNWHQGGREQSQNWEAWNQFLSAAQSSEEWTSTQ